MNRERYKRIAEIFHEAVAFEGSARREFVQRACNGDRDLFREVQNLLDHDAPRTDLFSDDRVGIARDLLARPATSENDAASPAPASIGHYRVIRRLGTGGMGTVYLAQQEHPRRCVALKMIRPGAMSSSMLRRFRLETEVLGRLHHPGIAQIYEAGEVETDSGRQPYFAMEYVEGVGLRQYVEQHSLDVRARLELIARVCDAVQHAHQRSIVHRDLKPDNVLVVEEPAATSGGATQEFARLGQPKVLDFGVARATDSDLQTTTLRTDVGQLVGTLAYMSPEQVSGDAGRLDTRADIYALGVMLYELLAGQPPFDLRAKSIPEAARIIREDEPARLGTLQTVFRGDIDTIVCRALEKDRERRYASAAELAADIRHFLAHEPISAHPPSTFYHLRKFATRNRGLVLGLTLSLVILLLGLISSVVLAVRATRSEHLARISEQRSNVDAVRALRSETAAHRALYQLRLTAAEVLSDKDPVRALDDLEAAPLDYRGWEWRHLQARCDALLATQPGERDEPYAATIARTPDGTLLAALLRGPAIELVELETGSVRDTFAATGPLAAPNLSSDGTRLAAFAPDEKKLVVWDVPSRQRLLEHPVADCDPGHTRFSPDGRFLTLSSRTAGLTVLNLTANSVAMQTAPRLTNASVVTYDPRGTRLAVVHWREGGYASLVLYASTGQLLAHTDLDRGGQALAFSPNGRQIAVGCEYDEVRVLDATTLDLRHVLKGHTARVCGVAWSPDGRLLASSSTDNTTRIWDLAADKCRRVLAGGGAAALAFSSDGTRLAAGSPARARLWLWQHKARRVLRCDGNYVYFVAFSPDGSRLASSVWSGNVRLWDPATGDQLAVLPASCPHAALGFTPDGTRLVAYETDPHYRRVQHERGTGVLQWTPMTEEQALRDVANSMRPLVWNIATGTRVSLPPPAARSENDPGRRIGWAWDYLRLAAGGAKATDYWHGQPIASSRDHTRMAHGSANGEIEILDVATGRTICRLHDGTARVKAVDFSPDGTRLVSGRADGIVQLWDLAGGTLLASGRGHAGAIYSVAYHPDGTRIASGGVDGTVLIWDTKPLEPLLALRGHTSYVHAVAFSPDGTLLASGSGDGTVRLWDSLPAAQRWARTQRADDPRHAVAAP